MSSAPSPLGEVERIQSVYQNYSSDPSVQAAWSKDNPGNQAIISERAIRLNELLHIHISKPLKDCHILDIGCGSGRTLAEFQQWGARPQNLFGVDLVADRIEEGRLLHPDLHFQAGNAEHLEFNQDSFDMIILFTVFSSILDNNMQGNVAKEINRILKSGGTIIWYDFRYRNPNNPHTRPMRKADISRLFPTFQQNLLTVTVVPPLARRLGRLTATLYPLFAKIPFLKTHYLGLLKKPC